MALQPLHEFIFSVSKGPHSAAKRLAFARFLVRSITGTENYDDLSFLLTRYADVHAFLHERGEMTRNRYATHILGMFPLLEADKDVDAELVEECRGRYRLIVSTTKRAIRCGWDEKTPTAAAPAAATALLAPADRPPHPSLADVMDRVYALKAERAAGDQWGETLYVHACPGSTFSVSGSGDPDAVGAVSVLAQFPTSRTHFDDDRATVHGLLVEAVGSERVWGI